MVTACLGSTPLRAELYEFTESNEPRIAIIIDDMGHRRAAGLAVLDLPGQITYSILPFTPNGQEFAERARERNREVMLHMPMESRHGYSLGPGGLTTKMGPEQIERLVLKNLRAIPHIIGVNNHMGSRFTTDYDAMSAVMSTLRRRAPSLFFVDSVTTGGSIVSEAARRHGVPVASRSVFLDHEIDEAAIRSQFRNLVRHARKYGRAIAIGHPHWETIKILREELPKLEQYGVALEPISRFIPRRCRPAIPQMPMTALLQP